MAGWFQDATSAIGWLASEAFAGQSPQQVQAGFQQLGISAEDFLSWWRYQQGNVPVPGGSSPMAFDVEALGRWLTTAPATQPGAQPASQAAAPRQAQAGLGRLPAGVDQATVQGVLRAAQEMGVPAQLALAIAYKESSFDSNAVGDNGCSVGVMQLNTCAGEGAGVPDYVLRDPYLNARISLQQVRQVMQQNPGASLGQIAAMAQRPADAQGYADSINQFVDSAQTGQGPLGWAQSLTTGSLTQRQALPGGTNQVPLPFSRDFFSAITQGFGENGEQGTDFGMPEGNTITSPVGGTIETRDDGHANWGRAVYVHMPNGWTFFVGHLMDFGVTDGMTISPGEVLGTSGGGPQSVSPGDSTGPHVEVRFIDPSGRNQDPMPFLQQLFQPTGSGASASNLFSNWAGGLFQGSTQVVGTPQDLRRTPDNHILDFNSQLGQWYQAVDSVWRSVYGIHAPLQAALDFQSAGIKTVDQIQSAVDTMPSNVLGGVSVGQWRSMQQVVNQQSQSSLGRPAPQSLVKQFFQQGIRTAADVRLWFEGHSSSDIPPDDFRQVFDAANQYTQPVWGDYPHPDQVVQAWQQAGGQPVPSQSLSPQDQVAKTIADAVAGVF